MYKGKKIGVVIPVYNEEKLISKVITSLPEFVDRILVIDDASTDQTSKVVQGNYKKLGNRLILIGCTHHLGKGSAIIIGYQRAVQEGIDNIATMDGDAQMDPNDLPALLDPLVSGDADFSKGNRFANREAWSHMPKVRYYANVILSVLNKLATGYWHIADPQSGYTAISRLTLDLLDLQVLSKGYHFENSLLLHMKMINARVVNIPVRAIYGVGEESGINHWWALFSFSFYLLRIFIWRLKEQYINRNFHPLIIFYILGFFFFLIGLGLGLTLLIDRLLFDFVQSTWVLIASGLLAFGFLFFMIAIWIDKIKQG
jgi:glycosyltransferase involved in cell wall biosynthesis